MEDRVKPSADRTSSEQMRSATGCPDNKSVVAAFVDFVNRQDWPGLSGVVHEKFTRISQAAGPINSRDELISFLQGEFATFPDAYEVIEDILSDGDRVAVRHRFTGTQRGPLGPHPPSGRRMDAPYLAIYEVHDGRITRAWVEWDNLSGLRQLGHVPSTP